MNDEFQWWLLVVGLAVGAALVWLLIGVLPRRDEDVTDPERSREAEWISAVVEGRGGVAPALLVEEVLELHREYLRGPALQAPEDERASDESWSEDGSLTPVPEEVAAAYRPPMERPPVPVRQNVPDRTAGEPWTSSRTMNRSPDLPGSTTRSTGPAQ